MAEGTPHHWRHRSGPDASISSSNGTFARGGRNRIARADHMSTKFLLREVIGVERHDEIYVPLLSTDAERFISWVRRDVAARGGWHIFSDFPNEIDDFPDQVWA